MKKRILLLIPRYMPGWMKNGRCMFKSWSGTQWRPVLMAFLGAFLEGKGYAVSLIDAQSSGMSDFEVGREIGWFKPDYACVLGGDQSLDLDLTITKSINERFCPARIVGPHVSHWIRTNKVRSCPAIIHGLERGVLSWINGSIPQDRIIYGERLSSEDLCRMPLMSEFMHRHLKDHDYVTPSEPYPFTSFFIGRGCYWGKCTFCLWPQEGGRGYVSRPIEEVIYEVSFIERYLSHYRSIMIEDDSLPVAVARDFSLCKIRAGLRKPWSCYIRPNFKYKTLKLMKKAGCLNVHVGYESGNDETLLRLRKGITTNRMEQFTRDAKRAGLHIHGDFMIGVDADLEKTKKTVSWACDVIRPHSAQFQVHMPYDNDQSRQESGYFNLTNVAALAYRRFYRNPRAWPAILRQIGKPRILVESFNSVFGKWRIG